MEDGSIQTEAGPSPKSMSEVSLRLFNLTQEEFEALPEEKQRELIEGAQNSYSGRNDQRNENNQEADDESSNNKTPEEKNSNAKKKPRLSVKSIFGIVFSLLLIFSFPFIKSQTIKMFNYGNTVMEKRQEKVNSTGSKLESISGHLPVIGTTITKAFESHKASSSEGKQEDIVVTQGKVNPDEKISKKEQEKLDATLSEEMDKRINDAYIHVSKSVENYSQDNDSPVFQENMAMVDEFVEKNEAVIGDLPDKLRGVTTERLDALQEAKNQLARANSYDVIALRNKCVAGEQEFSEKFKQVMNKLFGI